MRYKIHKHLLCMDPKETEKAIKHASEAVALLLKIGSNTDGYNVEFQANNRTFIYSKKVENIDIGKFITKANSSDKVIINEQYLVYKIKLKIIIIYIILSYIFLVPLV